MDHHDLPLSAARLGMYIGRILCAWVAVGALVAPQRSARAHGTIPATNGISWGPGTGGMLFGTNFGALWRSSEGGPDRFICETLVEGNQGTLDVWVWLGSGAIVATAIKPGSAHAIYASTDASGCAFGVVPTSEAFGARDLVADPGDARAFLAAGYVAVAGTGFYTGQIVRGTPGVAPVVLLAREQVAATGVRASGAAIYAAFGPLPGNAGALSVAHSGDGGATWDEHPFNDGADAAGATLRPLGIDPGHAEIAWFTAASDTGDVLLRSEDQGATLVPVATIAGHITGFVISADGAKAWVQTAGAGLMRSTDGGKSFVPLKAGANGPHGTCLALAPDGRVVVCGVAWVDGFAYGISDDGETFASAGVDFDAIAGPITCPDRPEVAALCQVELDFLRTTYGFARPDETGESAGAGDVAVGADVAVVAEPSSASGGCDGGAGRSTAVWAAISAGVLTIARRRPKHRVLPS